MQARDPLGGGLSGEEDCGRIPAGTSLTARARQEEGVLFKCTATDSGSGEVTLARAPCTVADREGAWVCVFWARVSAGGGCRSVAAPFGSRSGLPAVCLMPV